ncbi:MAG TPA: hypothetical protein VFA50_20945 [Stellaceae bacterium]|nr:hypothetical protein [Stellaceae bacterium]
MNGFLVGILNVLNQLLAIFLIVSGTIAGVHGRFEPYYGAYGPPQSWEAVIGGVIGFVCGIIAAGLICGFVALIITISRELNLIRDRLAYPPIVSAPPPRI